MKAVLTTLCGCTREMWIPYPPNRAIEVPLCSDRLGVWFNEDEPPPSYVGFKVRRFELRRAEGGPYGKADYVETEGR